MGNLTKRSVTFRYLLALLAPALMAGVMQLTWPLFEQSPVALFLLAIMFSGWYGGFRPGALSLLVSIPLADYFFIYPYSSLGPHDRNDLITLLVLTTIGLFSSLLSESTHKEKRRAEVNLESAGQAELKYRDIFENAVEGIFQTSPTGGFIHANPALTRMLGFETPEQLIRERGDGKEQRYHDPQRHKEYFRLLQTQGMVRDFEYKEYRKDGSQIWVSDNVRAVRDEDGQLLYYEGTTQDISERKRAEGRSAAFAALAGKLSGARVPLSAAQTIADTAQELFGWDSCALKLYDANRDLIHPLLYIDTVGGGQLADVTPVVAGTRPAPRSRLVMDCGAQLTLREAPFEFAEDSVPFGDTQRPSASVMTVPIRHSAEVIGILSIQSYRPHAYDLEALSDLQALADHCGAALNRIWAEEALRESEERYRELFENARDAAYLHDLNGRYISVNRAAERLSGQTRDEIIGRKFSDFIPLEEVGAVSEHLLQKLIGEGETTYETEVIASEGRRVPVEVRSHLIYENGTPVGIQGTARDITERMRADERLREYEKVVEGLEEMIVVVDRDFRYLLANRAYQKLRGMTREQLLGRLVPDVVGEDIFQGVIKGKLEQSFLGQVVSYEIRTTYPELGERDMLSSYFPIEGTTGIDRVAVVLQDITERKRDEQALRNYSRLLIEAQETERQSIARELHDQIGQVLTAIRLNLQTVWDTCETSESRALIDEGVSILDLALDQVRDLSFELRPSLLDDLGLVAALHWYCDRFAHRTGIRCTNVIDLPEGTRLRLELETASFRIVQEALTNVLRHAGARNVSITLRSLKNEICLFIKDDGQGFDAHSQGLSQFTTHLGLRGMRERALALGGQFEIKSSPARGTEISARFPGQGNKD